MDEQAVIGWREWVALPDLGIEAVKAKIDTGARTSSLHAFNVQLLQKRTGTVVRFSVHPYQRNFKTTVTTEAKVLEFRTITSSTGHQSQRPVILTNVTVLGKTWPIEITLANRDSMGFRMLLGRQAIRNHMLVDPGKSYLGGKRKNIVPKGHKKKRRPH